MSYDPPADPTTLPEPPKLAPELRRVYPKIGPNERCPCGSTLKFKKCHGRSLGGSLDRLARPYSDSTRAQP